MKTHRLRTCSEPGCSRSIRQYNRTGMCQSHSQRKFNFARQRRLKEEHLCLNCGKPVKKTIIIDDDERVEKFYVRCKQCRNKRKNV